MAGADAHEGRYFVWWGGSGCGGADGGGGGRGDGGGNDGSDVLFLRNVLC